MYWGSGEANMMRGKKSKRVWNSIKKEFISPWKQWGSFWSSFCFPISGSFQLFLQNVLSAVSFLIKVLVPLTRINPVFTWFPSSLIRCTRYNSDWCFSLLGGRSVFHRVSVQRKCSTHQLLSCVSFKYLKFNSFWPKT